MKHQKSYCRSSYDYYKANSNCLALFGEVGVGKTFAYLCLAFALSQKKILIITTSFLKFDVVAKMGEYFEEEIPYAIIKGKKNEAKYRKDCIKYLGMDKKDVKELTLGQMKYRLRKAGKYNIFDTTGTDIYDARVIVVNYELIHTYIDELLDIDYDLIIADESHKIMTPSSQRTRAAFKLKYYKPDVMSIIATGTPTNGKLESLWSQMKFLGVDLGRTFSDFKANYCEMGGFKNKQIVGYRNQEVLESIIRGNSMVIRTKDVLDLPDHYVNKVRFQLSDKFMKGYKEFEKEQVLELEGMETISVENKLTMLIKLSSYTSGFINYTDDYDNEYIEVIHKQKLDTLKDVLKNTMADESARDIIIWSRFKISQKMISEMLDKEKIKHLMLTGDTSNKEKVLEKFKKDKKIRVIIISNAIAEGYDLLNSNVSIYYENTYNMIEKLQSRGRNYRNGAKDTVREINIVAADTIDEVVLDVINQKLAISEKVMSRDEVDDIFKTVTGR